MPEREVLRELICNLANGALDGSSVIPWASPVPFFGDPSSSRAATLGLNPSDREFEYDDGSPLVGRSRRLHTLDSLGIRSWADAGDRHIDTILDDCRSYFTRNPYRRWFNASLGRVASGVHDSSFYAPSYGACHLDLVPYATSPAWADIGQSHSRLLRISGDTLGRILRDSTVEVLILNGQSVVNHFGEMLETDLEYSATPRLPQNIRTYWGCVDTVHGIRFEREILVLGFNRYIQQFVSREATYAIRDWIAQVVNDTPCG